MFFLFFFFFPFLFLFLIVLWVFSFLFVCLVDWLVFCRFPALTRIIWGFNLFRRSVGGRAEENVHILYFKKHLDMKKKKPTQDQKEKDERKLFLR